VSALYFATARNDEVQFQDDKGAGELFIGRLLSWCAIPLERVG